MDHDWIKSTLGHGETMCSRCFVTNREAAAIGMHKCESETEQPDTGKRTDWYGKKLKPTEE